MKTSLLLLLTLLVTGLAPAFGQAPWAYVDGFSDGYYNYMQYLRAPQTSVLWGMATSYPMMQTSGSSVFRTLDNGQTWEKAGVAGYGRPQGPSGPNSGTQAEDLAVLDDHQAWLVRYAILNFAQVGNPELLYTATGPTGFATRVSALPAAFRKIHFFTATTGVAVANPAAGATTWPLYRTTDGGLTWVLLATTPTLPGGGSKNVLDKYSVGNSLWITTTANTLLYTADAGLTWATTAVTGKVVFEDELHGLAYSNDADPAGMSPGSLLRTTDGGHSWAAVNQSRQPFLQDIAAIPGQPGTYIGVSGSQVVPFNAYYGTTATSHDYGTSWTTVRTEGVKLEHVTATSASQIWGSQTGTPDSQLLHYASSVLAAKARATTPLLAAYPNPTSGLVSVAGSLPAGAEARVYDVAGRLCQTTRLTDGQRTVDLSAQAPGLYQLVVVTADGTLSSQRLHKTP